jgi:2-polyprenyl-3-methyl-5-hydroxy-6-metoxy-1,4-benzoquinol methylase
MIRRSKKEKDILNFKFDWEALDACPLCKHTILIPNGNIEWLNMDFWYVVCTKCNLKFMNPRPTQKSYQDFYKNVFWEHKIRNIGFKKQGQAWSTERYAWYNDKKWDVKKGKAECLKRDLEMRFEVITETLKKHIALNKKADILEVGAGFGVVMREINKRFGSTTHVIEPSKEAQVTIKKYGKVKIAGNYAEDLEKVCRKKQKFDALVFSHSLENTQYPDQILVWAKKCLKPKGVIYVQTPNLFTFDQMNPYHPYIFSEPTLTTLAKKLGLKLKRHGEPTHRMLTIILKKQGNK